MAERIQSKDIDILITPEQLLDKSIIDSLIEPGRVPVTFSVVVGTYDDITRVINERLVHICSVPPEGSTLKDKITCGHELQGRFCEFYSPDGVSRGKPLDFELTNDQHEIVIGLIKTSLKEHGLDRGLKQKINRVLSNLHLI